MLKTISKQIYYIYQRINVNFLSPIFAVERRSQGKISVNERPIEYSFALAHLGNHAPKFVLDIGPGISSWPHLLSNCGYHVTAIDKIDGYWGLGYANRHYPVIRDDITNPRIEQKFDFITCISTIEHIPDHRAAIAGMFKLLNPGGYIAITCPHTNQSYISDIYRTPGAGYGQTASYVCQVFSGNEIADWLNIAPSELVDEKYYQVFTGDYWTYGERLSIPLPANKSEKHHLACLLIQKGS